MSTTVHPAPPEVTPRRLLPSGWPLTALYAAFPLWWLMGISHFVFIVFAVPMALELVRRRPLHVPHGFGFWLLFLTWVTAGITVLWADAPGAVAGGSLGRLVPFTYRGLWLVAITVVCLYVMNLSEKELPTLRVIRLVAVMFVLTLLGGLAGLALPRADFPSLLEMFRSVGDSGFVYSLVHPRLSDASEFLGYVQPRPVAPFAYANAWGNNLAMFLPFFCLAWLGKDAGWRHKVAPLLLVLACVPIAYSLNRGLWGGLFVAALLVVVKLATMGRIWTVGLFAAVVVVGGSVFVATPLYDTVTLRIDTPHSNDRRGTVAETIIGSTMQGSPVLGFGSNREVQGSYSSIAGAGTPDCRQCAAPPMGTQGFLWRLIFTTGFVGTALYLGFMLTQLRRHLRSEDPIAIAGCVSIVMSLVFFFVYDSLESPLYTLLLAIGLMNRRLIGGTDRADMKEGAA
ncbi:MAG: hypothetical protein M3419_01135 [Actinomycetota bacterium]|nr:hypothetical protein [Actinomycetota bacterium]